MRLNRKVFSSPLASDGSLPNWLFYLIPTVILCGWVIIAGPPHVSGYYIIHYLYTYKHGFIPRGLIGEIISWFTDSVSDQLIQTLAVVFSLVLALAASRCIGRVLSKVKNDKENFLVVLFIILIICIIPGSFRLYFSQMTQDKLLWALTLFAVLLCDNKYAIWFTPLLCFISTLINPVYLFCSMILIAIIMLQEFKSSGYSVKNGIICAVSYIAMIAIGIYGVLSEKTTGFQTPQEFLDFYFSRYAGQLDAGTYQLFVEEWIFDYFEPMNRILERTFKTYFLEWGNAYNCFIALIFLALPFYAVLASFWKQVMRRESDKFQKLIFFLCLISPIVIIPPTIVSWEFVKYFYNNILVQLSLIIYYIVRKNPTVTNTVSDWISAIKSNPLPAAVALVYLTIFIA
ncbi:MAG: hypothetical protein PUC33_03225 [Oscillospiraceae bacterium]|nr:hypothetical protein [Oscillospiraceae bacterium]MDD6145609.1 hypothetical protein [Oscillospiraceae bacterium]